MIYFRVHAAKGALGCVPQLGKQLAVETDADVNGMTQQVFCGGGGHKGAPCCDTDAYMHARGHAGRPTTANNQRSGKVLFTLRYSAEHRRTMLTLTRYLAAICCKSF